MQLILKNKIKPKFAALSFLLILLSVFAVSCSNAVTLGIIREQAKEGNGYFTIWVNSDIQPRNEEEYEYYKTAIDDINKNVPNVNISVVPGDIIHWSRSPHVFQWFNDMKKRSYIKYWYEIAGNHDQKDYESYKKYINKPLHYSVLIGNMLILLLSDENKNAETEISDRAFEWWKRMVISNQDKIIITVTHGYLMHSGLFGAFEPTRNVRNSERFADVLKKYRVDMWLCGHMHLPHWVNTRVRIRENLGGTIFLNVSFIRGNILKNPESNILIFKKGSDNVLIRSRDHEEEEYNDWMDLLFKLSHGFEWDGNEPVMKASD